MIGCISKRGDSKHIFNLSHCLADFWSFRFDQLGGVVAEGSLGPELKRIDSETKVSEVYGGFTPLQVRPLPTLQVRRMKSTEFASHLCQFVPDSFISYEYGKPYSFAMEIVISFKDIVVNWFRCAQTYYP